MLFKHPPVQNIDDNYSTGSNSHMPLKRLETIEVTDRTAFLLTDLIQVPSTRGKESPDRYPYKQLLSSINLLLTRSAARIVLAGHSPVSAAGRTSFQELSGTLSAILEQPVEFAADLDELKNLLSKAEAKIILLENLSKFEGEVQNKESFAKEIAGLVDLFVNDSLESCRHPFATVTKLPLLAGESCAGVQLYRELDALQTVLSHSRRPLGLIVGGINLERKMPLLKRLLSFSTGRVEQILIGGAAAYTFLKSRANQMGSSLIENSMEVDAFQIIEKAELNEIEIQLPVDHLIGKEFTAKDKRKLHKKRDIPEGWMGLDLGPKTVSSFESALKKMQTILWMGPMGAIEFEDCSSGTRSLGKSLSKHPGQVIVTGKSLIAKLDEDGYASEMDCICMHSDAVLEYLLENGKLPGILALNEEDGELS